MNCPSRLITAAAELKKFAAFFRFCRLMNIRRRFLEFFDPRSKVELQGPGAARLHVEMPVGFGDGDWVQQAVGRPLLLEMSVPLRTDLTVNVDMGDMDPFRPQFSRHGLRQRTEAEFSDRQIGEARSAAQRCR